ncbi:MAG: hypothetical protein IJ173_09810 [Kiritimatiellae bacterium]|nr:hypothetical protein [Kiritimatiellia bacterium]
MRANDTDTKEVWKTNFKAIAENPGCCDEIWFSTGTGAPTLDWHRARAEVLAEAVKDVRAAGIAPSLQFQATIGHDDCVGTPEMFARKTWTGWTDWKGVEDRYCNCPRQTAFLAYLRDVSAIYARLGFAALWIDDDLRIAYHRPADSSGRRSGCFCRTCIAAFNAETGGKWTRETLAGAVLTDDAVCARWRRFSIQSLVHVARAVGEVFHALSPDTRMGLQCASGPEVDDQALAVLQTLHDVTGRPVGCRPGGGSYYDDDPNIVVLKSINAAALRGRIGNPGYIDVWTPEIESWPRTYYARSAQGVLAEGFAALMYGYNSVSFFVSNGAMEETALYGRTMWRPLAEASRVLRGYARVTDGCEPVGFTLPVEKKIGVRSLAIPVISGLGRSAGALTKEEAGKNANLLTSADVQSFREALDARAGGLPAVVKSPFRGLMQVHVDKAGRLRSVALLNLRISEQGPVRILLRGVPPTWKGVVWHEMRREPVKLALERTGGETYATIPSVGAWNGGYLSGAGAMRDGTGD